MNHKFPLRPHAPVAQADDWDGPYYRPFFSEEYIHREWWPDHLLSLNALDSEGCWIYTISGHGIYRCGNQRKVLGPGQVFAYRSPDRGQICLDRSGLPWHVVDIHVAGAPALAMFDFIVSQFGMFHDLPVDCSAIKLAKKLIRLVEKQPMRTAHFWSRHTFAWLDAWWECAQTHCGALKSILREAPHNSRLIGLKATNVKALAEQLGFSRSHLSRKLKWQWDMPPGAVLRNVRMEEAAKLLRMSDLTISNIAVELGFSTPSAFTRAFKKAFGQGPLVYRIAHGNGIGIAKRGRNNASLPPKP